jgi:energy-converting hydrogenase Eha subunit A
MTTTARGTSSRTVLRKAGRFLWHYVQMCMAMCLGAALLSLAFFGGAALIGYPDLLGRAPLFSTLVFAVNLSLPMIAWMRFRRHEWRPTLEMAGATMGLGIFFITASSFGLIPASDAFEWVARLACPAMLVPMVFRIPLYSGGTGHHAA